jgi:hypothetical protein
MPWAIAFSPRCFFVKIEYLGKKMILRGDSMSWVAIGAGAVISILVLMWLIKVIKATIQTAVIIAAIVFAMNFFGIGIGNVIEYIFGFLLNLLFGSGK